MNVRADVYAELPPLVEVVLTPREREVAKLLLCGMGNVEISHCLGIGTRCVKHHMRTMAYKAGMNGRLNRVQLAMNLSGAY